MHLHQASGMGGMVILGSVTVCIGGRGSFQTCSHFGITLSAGALGGSLTAPSPSNHCLLLKTTEKNPLCVTSTFRLF